MSARRCAATNALVVASAAHQGCRYVLSEDLQHGQQIDSVQVLDPFIVGPEVLEQSAAP
jgi:predicted nucleic acid-binding protein